MQQKVISTLAITEIAASLYNPIKSLAEGLLYALN